MTVRTKFVSLLLLFFLAIGLNLFLTKWGTDLEGVALLTIRLDAGNPLAGSGTPGFGCYSAHSPGDTAWISMCFGLFVPLICIGLISYILVRMDSRAAGS